MIVQRILLLLLFALVASDAIAERPMGQQRSMGQRSSGAARTGLGQRANVTGRGFTTQVAQRRFDRTGLDARRLGQRPGLTGATQLDRFGANRLGRDQVGTGQRSRLNATQRQALTQINPERTSTGGRFAQHKTAKRVDAQRNFLGRNFKGHNWNWWYRNNPAYFFAYFPANFYQVYGYYPPVYYDYYELIGAYPTTDIVLVDDSVNPPAYDALSSTDECIQNCMNLTSLSIEDCMSECARTHVADVGY